MWCSTSIMQLTTRNLKDKGCCCCDGRRWERMNMSRRRSSQFNSRIKEGQINNVLRGYQGACLRSSLTLSLLETSHPDASVNQSLMSIARSGFINDKLDWIADLNWLVSPRFLVEIKTCPRDGRSEWNIHQNLLTRIQSLPVSAIDSKTESIVQTFWVSGFNINMWENHLAPLMRPQTGGRPRPSGPLITEILVFLRGP